LEYLERMKLRDYMRREGMTAAELATLIGVSTAAVVRYRNGTRRPSPEVMRRIAHVTGGAVLPNDFYDLPAPAADAAGSADDEMAGSPIRRAGGG